MLENKALSDAQLSCDSSSNLLNGFEAKNKSRYEKHMEQCLVSRTTRHWVLCHLHRQDGQGRIQGLAESSLWWTNELSTGLEPGTPGPGWVRRSLQP